MKGTRERRRSIATGLYAIVAVAMLAGFHVAQVRAGVCDLVAPPLPSGTGELCCKQNCECPATTRPYEPNNYCATQAKGYCHIESISYPPYDPSTSYKICSTDADCDPYGWCVIAGECYDANGQPTGRGCVVDADPSLGSCMLGGGGSYAYAWCDNAHPYPCDHSVQGCQVGQYLWGAPCNPGETCVACPSGAPPACGQLAVSGSTPEGTNGVLNVTLLIGLPIGAGVLIAAGLRKRKGIPTGLALLFVLLGGAALIVPLPALGGVCERVPTLPYYQEWIHSDVLCCKVDCDCPATNPASGCNKQMTGYCAEELFQSDSVDYKTCSTDADCAGYGDWCLQMGEIHDANGNPTGRACVVGADATLGACEGENVGLVWCDATHPPPSWCGGSCMGGIYLWGRPLREGETCVACPGQAPAWTPAATAQIAEHGTSGSIASSKLLNALILVFAPLGVAGCILVINKRRRKPA